MNFSGISNSSWLGATLRRPLGLVPPDSVVRVLQGPLRGKRWLAGSSSHGCWLGSYEHQKQALFARFVRPGDVVLDVGAHVGYYTLLSSVLSGAAGHVVAFEPLPANVVYLRRHLALNSVPNVAVIEAAVCDTSALATFLEAPSTSMGVLDPAGALMVRTVALDDMVASGDIGTVHVIKIDVEGSEVAVLAGASRLLCAQHPVVFLALHGDQQREVCVGLLTEAGYQIEPLDAPSVASANELVARPAPAPPSCTFAQ